MFHCDNALAINIANNIVPFDHTKYVKIDRFFIKMLDSGVLRLEYIKSHSQLVFIKDLDQHELSCNRMELTNIFGPSCGGIGVKRNLCDEYLCKWYE
jgi:hypothetical protein